MKLKNKTAIVTGGARDIGRSCSIKLAAEGANVVVNYFGSEDGANETVETIKAAGGNAIAVRADMTKASDADALASAAIEAFGEGIDILVNEFPLTVGKPLADGDAELGQLLERRAALVNEICKATLPQLKKSPAGRVINVGFLRSLFAEDGSGAFAAAEQNLAELTRELAAKTGDFGITANYIQPGAIMTPVSREVFRKDMPLRDFCIRQSAARRVDPTDQHRACRSTS